MGSMQAGDYAQGVQDGVITLRQAVIANLLTNHYPPISSLYYDPVIKAIEAVNCGFPDADIDITAVRPSGMTPRLSREVGDRLLVTAHVLVEITHSEPFCQGRSDD